MGEERGKREGGRHHGRRNQQQQEMRAAGWASGGKYAQQSTSRRSAHGYLYGCHPDSRQSQPPRTSHPGRNSVLPDLDALDSEKMYEQIISTCFPHPNPPRLPVCFLRTGLWGPLLVGLDSRLSRSSLGSSTGNTEIFSWLLPQRCCCPRWVPRGRMTDLSRNAARLPAYTMAGQHSLEFP